MPAQRYKLRFTSLMLTLVLLACRTLTGPDPSPISEPTALPQPTQPAAADVPEADVSAFDGWQVSCGDQPVSSGDLAASGFLVSIPGHSFDQETSLDIASVGEVPEMPASEMALSQAVEVSAGAPVRLNQPTTISFLVTDPGDQEALADGGLWGAYYNGTEWEYFPPTRVDLAANTLFIDTYHFSLQGYGRINLEERLNQYAHSQALSSFVQSNMVDEAANRIVSQTLDHLLSEQLMISDESLKAKVLTSLVNDDAWGDMVGQLRAGQVEDFVKTLNVFAGQKIVENIDESVLAGSLEAVAGDSGVAFTEAAAQAAAYLTEGQPREAARILGEKIADQFLVTTLAKGGVEIIQHQIDTWKDAEIEAAYQAYKNGASGYFWGYNVEPGKFDDLYNQMRGIAVRLEQEAVQREIQRREAMQMRPATAEELDTVREQAKNSLREQFEARARQEEALAEQEANFRTLIGQLQAANLLEKHQFGFDPAYDSLETRLDKLFHLARKILRDTGRSDWTTGVLTTEEELSAGEMVTLIQIWYSEGRDQYAEELLKRYGIRLMPACRWEFDETKAYLSDGGGQFMVSFDGAAQVTTGYQFEGAMSCGTLTFNTLHSWTEPPPMLIPGDTVPFTVGASWDLQGDQSCSGLTAGVRTTLKIGDFSLSAGDSSIPTSTEPAGSLGASGDWTVPGGAPGGRLEIMAAPDGGGAGGTVRTFYNYVCEGN